MRRFSVLLSQRSSKILAPEQLEATVRKLKGEGKAVVTLNGSFDLLHPGHVDMIKQASQLGDVLILLLNTDESIKINKGKSRPINPLVDRLEMIASLEFVDLVSYFSETDPITILGKIQPNIHVNGSEYGEDCIEAEVVKKHGGRIHIIDLLPGYSSTNIIKKIKALCD